MACQSCAIKSPVEFQVGIARSIPNDLDGLLNFLAWEIAMRLVSVRWRTSDIGEERLVRLAVDVEVLVCPCGFRHELFIERAISFEARIWLFRVEASGISIACEKPMGPAAIDVPDAIGPVCVFCEEGLEVPENGIGIPVQEASVSVEVGAMPALVGQAYRNYVRKPLSRFGLIGLLAEIHRQIFGGEEAFALPEVGGVGLSELSHLVGHVAGLAPEHGPVLALLELCEVQIHVRGGDVGEVAVGMRVVQACRVEFLHDLAGGENCLWLA